jgi:hypothetical protein
MSINFPTNPDIGTPYSFQGVIWEWNGYGWYIVGSEADLFGLSGAGFFFPADLTTAFGEDRSFGKYGTGEIIPSEGKTAVTVIQEAMIAALAPTANLSSPTTIAFNQTAIGNTLNYSHTITAFGASIVGATLEFKRSNTVGWTLLSSSTASSGSFYHTLTDSNFNTAGFNYRYIVRDSNSQTAQAGITISPAAYVSPSASITQTAVTSSSPETNTKRERGNVITNISATVTRNTANVQLTGWEFIYSRNGGAYQTTGFTAAVSGVGASTTTGVTQHSPGNTATSVVYKVRIRDEYQDSLASYVDSAAASTINFVPFIFYGPTGSIPSTSNDVRSVTNRVFQDTSVFTLNTGTVYTKFVVAMPNTYTISSVVQASFDITAAYTDNLQVLNVADYAGNTSSYNVYTASSALPYSPAVDQTVTRQ